MALWQRRPLSLMGWILLICPPECVSMCVCARVLDFTNGEDDKGETSPRSAFVRLWHQSAAASKQTNILHLHKRLGTIWTRKMSDAARPRFKRSAKMDCIKGLVM